MEGSRASSIVRIFSSWDWTRAEPATWGVGKTTDLGSGLEQQELQQVDSWAAGAEVAGCCSFRAETICGEAERYPVREVTDDGVS
jgi:hypothetical protein